MNTYVKRVREDSDFMYVYRKTCERDKESDGRVRLCKDREIPYVAKNLSSPQKVAELMFQLFEINQLADEYSYVLGFDAKGNLLGIMETSHGTVDTCICAPREIYQAALLMNASRIIVLHTHPSGSCEPSKLDLKNKETMKKAGELLHVPLLDYIILGRNEYYSAAEVQEI